MNEEEWQAEILREVYAIMSALEAKKDPEYEATMRRVIPSKQQAHATRVPEVRKIVTEWLRAHKHMHLDDLVAIAETLWNTAWREERLVAIMLLNRFEDAIDRVDWPMIQRWSGDIDNWEHVDHLAEISARMLGMQPRLIGRVEQMSTVYNPWQRRLALVTMIVAGRDFAWRDALKRMADRMATDEEPVVKKAVTWARRELKQREGSFA